jgi:hypothetical protein
MWRARRGRTRKNDKLAAILFSDLSWEFAGDR